jgi:fructokinase
MQVLSFGEILWDIFADQELLGGAALNFSANIYRLGDSAALISAVGDDRRGREALAAMIRLGLTTEFVETTRNSPTGFARVNATSEGEHGFEIPRPAAFDRVTMTAEQRQKVIQIKPDWLYFGTLTQTEAGIEKITAELAAALPGVRCFYDMNLRTGHWNFSLVQRLSSMATVLKLNEAEAETLWSCSKKPSTEFTIEAFAELWAEQHGIQAIGITLGPAGCCVYEGGTCHRIPGYPASVQDTVGAGDAFAAAFLHGYHRKWPVEKTARFANALGSVVASRSGATPAWTMDEVLAIASVPPQHAADESAG